MQPISNTSRRKCLRFRNLELTVAQCVKCLLSLLCGGICGVTNRFQLVTCCFVWLRCLVVGDQAIVLPVFIYQEKTGQPGAITANHWRTAHTAIEADCFCPWPLAICFFSRLDSRVPGICTTASPCHLLFVLLVRRNTFSGG